MKKLKTIAPILALATALAIGGCDNGTTPSTTTTTPTTPAAPTAPTNPTTTTCPRPNHCIDMYNGAVNQLIAVANAGCHARYCDEAYKTTHQAIAKQIFDGKFEKLRQTNPTRYKMHDNVPCVNDQQIGREVYVNADSPELQTKNILIGASHKKNINFNLQKCIDAETTSYTDYRDVAD